MSLKEHTLESMVLITQTWPIYNQLHVNDINATSVSALKNITKVSKSNGVFLCQQPWWSIGSVVNVIMGVFDKRKRHVNFFKYSARNEGLQIRMLVSISSSWVQLSNWTYSVGCGTFSVRTSLMYQCIASLTWFPFVWSSSLIVNKWSRFLFRWSMRPERRISCEWSMVSFVFVTNWCEQKGRQSAPSNMIEQNRSGRSVVFAVFSFYFSLFLHTTSMCLWFLWFNAVVSELQSSADFSAVSSFSYMLHRGNRWYLRTLIEWQCCFHTWTE